MTTSKPGKCGESIQWLWDLGSKFQAACGKEKGHENQLDKEHAFNGKATDKQPFRITWQSKAGAPVGTKPPKRPKKTAIRAVAEKEAPNG